MSSVRLRGVLAAVLLAAPFGCGNGGNGGNGGSLGGAGAACTNHDQCANIDCHCSASMTVNNACICDSQGLDQQSGDCVNSGSCAGANDCTTLCSEAAPSCNTQSCTAANQCPQQSCACPSDGVVFTWNDCNNGCCSDACPGPTGPNPPGAGCLTNCACSSGLCSMGVCQ